jgi:CO dehydrogenase/acetyl-CoA synthase gamma subunit (corrinoid Fe-S protein)
MTFAADVVKGDAETEECVFLTLKAFEAKSKNLLDVIEQRTRKIRGGRRREDHDT